MRKPAALPFPLLLLNSTDREQVELAVVTDRKVVQLKKAERAQSLPALVPVVLKKAGLELADIRAVGVGVTAGSLTGTRLGVTVANSLGWLNDWPVASFEAPSIKTALRQLKTGQYTVAATAAVQNELVY